MSKCNSKTCRRCPKTSDYAIVSIPIVALFIFISFSLFVTGCASTPLRPGQPGYTTTVHYETRGDYYRGR